MADTRIRPILMPVVRGDLVTFSFQTVEVLIVSIYAGISKCVRARPLEATFCWRRSLCEAYKVLWRRRRRKKNRRSLRRIHPTATIRALNVCKYTLSSFSSYRRQIYVYMYIRSSPAAIQAMTCASPQGYLLPRSYVFTFRKRPSFRPNRCVCRMM